MAASRSTRSSSRAVRKGRGDENGSDPRASHRDLHAFPHIAHWQWRRPRRAPPTGSTPTTPSRRARPCWPACEGRGELAMRRLLPSTCHPPLPLIARSYESLRNSSFWNETLLVVSASLGGAMGGGGRALLESSMDDNTPGGCFNAAINPPSSLPPPPTPLPQPTTSTAASTTTSPTHLMGSPRRTTSSVRGVGRRGRGVARASAKGLAMTASTVGARLASLTFPSPLPSSNDCPQARTASTTRASASA